MQMPANDSPFEDMDERTSAGRLGMVIFLASLAMFFLAGIFAYVVIRLGDADSWPPPGMPDLPRILLFSTFAIVLSSGSLSMAQRAVRVGSEQLVGYWMIWTYILAIAFLVLQAIAWVQMIDAQADITRHLPCYERPTGQLVSGEPTMRHVTYLGSKSLACIEFNNS